MPRLDNAFTTLVGARHPPIQAPMAGGANTPELVAALSNAGALGSFAAANLARLDPLRAELVRQLIAELAACRL